MTLHLIDDKTAPKSQRFRWQLKSRNGKIVAASSEGFSTARDCATNARDCHAGLSQNVFYSHAYFFGLKPVMARMMKRGKVKP